MILRDTLLRKELRALRPFLALVLLFVVLDLAFFLFSEMPDQYSLARLFGPDHEGDQQLNFILAFALTAGLLVREKDEGTLSFLEALPVTRRRIFFSKFFLAFLVIGILPVVDGFLHASVYLWSRTSLDQVPQLPRIARDVFLGIISCFVYVSAGLALSFLRRFSLLALGLVICLYLLLAELRVPCIGLFNIFDLVDPLRPGPVWSLPGLKLLVHLLLGLVCLGTSYICFQAASDLRGPSFKRSTLLVLAGTTATVLGVLLWIGIGAWFVSKYADESSGTVQFRSWPKAHANTARYRFLYPGSESALVQGFLPHADSVESRVRQFLQAKPIPLIEADLTGSAPHTAGTAHWKKVNLQLFSAEGSVSNLLALLAHETTHVYMDYVTDSKISDEFNSTRFFHEGLATYIEQRFYRSASELQQSRRVAAVAFRRDQVRFSELCDNRVLSRRRDPDLVYPLGEVFIAGLVAIYGDDAPAKILRAAARSGAPKDLTGIALWQDVLQAAGFNLAAAEDAWIQLLREESVRHKTFIDSLPRLRGAARLQEGEVRIRASHNGQAPGGIVCRLRQETEDPTDRFVYAYADEGNEFSADAAAFAVDGFWYQLGWRAPEASQTIYEDWVQVPRIR